MSGEAPSIAFRSAEQCGHAPRLAFSLLEVILATAMIAASSMVLMRLISTGAQHQDRGTRKATAQLICQSLIDEMVIDPARRESVEDQLVPGYTGWIYSIQIEPTDFDGLIRARVQAVEVAAGQPRTTDKEDFDFELVRWLRSDDSQQRNRFGQP